MSNLLRRLTYATLIIPSLYVEIFDLYSTLLVVAAAAVEAGAITVRGFNEVVGFSG